MHMYALFSETYFLARKGWMLFLSEKICFSSSSSLFVHGETKRVGRENFSLFLSFFACPTVTKKAPFVAATDDVDVFALVIHQVAGIA